jgi:hypothetical protein
MITLTLGVAQFSLVDDRPSKTGRAQLRNLRIETSRRGSQGRMVMQ